MIRLPVGEERCKSVATAITVTGGAAMPPLKSGYPRQTGCRRRQRRNTFGLTESEAEGSAYIDSWNRTAGLFAPVPGTKGPFSFCPLR